MPRCFLQTLPSRLMMNDAGCPRSGHTRPAHLRVLRRAESDSSSCTRWQTPAPSALRHPPSSRRRRDRSCNCFCSSTKPGISALHGPHHVAQKFSRIDLALERRQRHVLAVEILDREIELRRLRVGHARAARSARSSRTRGAASGACDATGAIMPADDGSASTSCCQTNGTLIASSAMTVAAIAARRSLELG